MHVCRLAQHRALRILRRQGIGLVRLDEAEGSPPEAVAVKLFSTKGLPHVAREAKLGDGDGQTIVGLLFGGYIEGGRRVGSEENDKVQGGVLKKRNVSDVKEGGEGLGVRKVVCNANGIGSGFEVDQGFEVGIDNWPSHGRKAVICDRDIPLPAERTSATVEEEDALA